MAELTGSTLNYNKTILTAEFPKNTGTTENEYSVQVSGTSTEDASVVLSNTAKIYQSPVGKIVFSPTTFSVGSGATNSTTDIRVLLTNISPDNVAVTEWSESFIENPSVKCEGEVCYLCFYVRPNTTTAPRTGTVKLEAVDNYGNKTYSEIEISQAAGGGVGIEILNPTEIASYNTQTVTFEYQPFGGSFVPGTVGVLKKSSNLKNSSVQIDENSQTITLTLNENRSYIAETEYTVSLSAITEYNGYADSNTAVVTQSPRSSAGYIKVTPNASEITYTENSTTFRIISSGVTEMGPYAAGMVNCRDYQVNGDILTIVVDENESFTETKTIQVAVSGVSANGDITYGYATIKQRKAPGLFLGVSADDVAARVLAHEPQSTPFETTARWYNSYAILYFGALNVTNVRYSSEDATAEINQTNNKITVRFGQNLAEIPREISLTFSGVTEDGLAISKVCNIEQEKCVEGSILISWQGNTEGCTVDSITTALTFDYTTVGVDRISFSASTSTSVATIEMTSISESGFYVEFSSNGSYTDTYTYKIRLYGFNGNDDIITSNEFTITQNKAQVPEANIVWGEGPCPETRTEYEVSVASEATRHSVAYNFENITPNSVYASFDSASPFTDATIEVNTSEKRVTLTFDAYPATDQTYLVNLFGENYGGEIISSCNVLSLTHAAAPSATVEGKFDEGEWQLDADRVTATVDCLRTSVTATFTATTIDTEHQITLTSNDCWFDIGEWVNVGDGKYTCNCVINFPENTRYIEPGITSDEYTIESTVTSVAGHPAAGNILTVVQNRCKTTPYVRISLAEIEGVPVADPSTALIPYGTNNITWGLEVNNVSERSTVISIPEGSFIKDTDGTSNATEVWTGLSVSNLYKKAKIWKEEAEPATSTPDTGEEYINANTGTTANTVSVSGSGVNYGTVVAATTVTAVTINNTEVHAPGDGGKIVLKYQDGIGPYTIQTGGTIGFCTSMSVDETNRKITLYYSANTGASVNTISLKLKGVDIETNELIIVHDRVSNPTVDAWWTGSTDPDETVECTDTTLVLQVSGVSLNQSIRPILSTTGCTATVGDWINGVSTSIITFPENTRYIEGGVTGDTYYIDVAAYNILGGITNCGQQLSITQKRCRTLPEVSISLSKIDATPATASDTIPYNATAVTWSVSTNNIAVSSASIVLPAVNSFIANTDGATNGASTTTFESVSRLVAFETLWKESSNPSDNHNDTGSTYVESGTVVVSNTVNVLGQGLDYGQVSGSVTVNRTKYTDATVYAPSVGGTLTLQYTNLSGALDDVSIKTGGTLCQSITVDGTNNKVYLVYEANTTSQNKTLTIYLKSDLGETNRLNIVQEPRSYVTLTMTEIDGQPYSSGVIPYLAEDITFEVETNAVEIGTAGVEVPTGDTFIYDVDGATNQQETGSFNSQADLFLFEKLWKTGSNPDTGTQDTGITYLDGYSGATANIVTVTGTSTDGNIVSGSTEIERMFYREATIYAPANGGVVNLQYTDSLGEMSEGIDIVTAGTGCIQIYVDETAKTLDLYFSRNTSGGIREFTIFIESLANGSRSNTLKVVQEEAPNLTLSFDNVSTVMYSEDLVASDVTTVYWKVNYKGIVEGTIGVDLENCQYVLAGTGNNETTSGEIPFVSSLINKNTTRTNREIILTITGATIYGGVLSASASATQVGIIDLKMFSPVNVRAEGDIIYVSIATTNVAIDSVVCDDPLVASGMFFVSGTSSVTNTGLTIYSIDVPTNLSCWADETPSSPTQIQITASKEGYNDSKFVVSCGDVKEVRMFENTRGLRVFTVTVTGHDSEGNEYMDYVVIVQRDTPEKAAVVVCGDTRYSALTATTLNAGTIRANSIVVNGPSTLSCPTTICDTLTVDEGEVNISGNLSVAGDVESNTGFWQNDE